MKLKWLIKTPTSFGNSERHCLNVVLFQLWRCLSTHSVSLFPELRTNNIKDPICSFLTATLFWKQSVGVLERFVLFQRTKIKLWLSVVLCSSNAEAVLRILMLFDAVRCVVRDCVIREEENIVHCLVQSKAQSVLSSINHQTVSRRGCNRPPSKHFVWHTKIRASIELNTKSAH